jgi:eukaryotic-like serine/threonine-protein kinase
MLRGFQFILVLLMLGVLAMVSAVVTMHFAIHGAEVAVPDFKNLTVVEATSKAASMGLEINVDNHFYSVDIPVGRIVNQSPAPGTVVRREWHVRLTQSLGPQRVAIPRLVGSDQRLASIEIRRVGLELGQDAEMPDSYAAPGAVIAQNPGPNAPGVERPSVSLLVAKDPDPTTGGVVMPDFIGHMFSSAAMEITRAGLQLAPMKEQQVSVPAVGDTNTAAPPQPVVPIGSVIAQSPAPGHRVDAATPVEFTVAQ